MTAAAAHWFGASRSAFTIRAGEGVGRPQRFPHWLFAILAGLACRRVTWSTR